MKSHDLRQKFLDFFVSKGHRIEPSAPLVPHEDPSLLWINSGVATLKKYFDGTITPDNPRITNSQKSIRTNDIENVGKTRRHHTMFEMLGNFSIGDYFKEESIIWAWEFLTDKKWIGFEPDKLYVTIHPEDDEAFSIWHEKVGLEKERIVRLEGNFWDIGEGPSGPNSEIFYDRGEHLCDSTDPECYPGGENERYLEVWNLVFSQFNHNPDGSYTPLPKKNIDTGMGLERMASILQKGDSNYDTDLFLPLIDATCSIANVEYHKNADVDVALKVIADHVRAVTFAVGDGAMPSNEGRGYVIRRLLRRAVRFGKVLGIDRPFLHQLVPIVGEVMGSFYPEVVEKRDFIVRVVKTEEERFHETLSEGLSILTSMIDKAKSEGREVVTGEEAFKLYDTYGFPLDLTEDFAVEHGITVDRDGFEAAMNEQRERARTARQDVESMKVQGGVLSDITVNSQFVGYTELVTSAKIVELIYNNQFVDFVAEGKQCQVILDRTPFYAESGGQISDGGYITSGQTQLTVDSVSKAPHGQHIQTVTVKNGTIRKSDIVEAVTNHEMRSDIVKNHTATHLLHKALKEVLGGHVNQAGSLVQADRLRFDFSHFGAITEQELVEIERRVNDQVWNGTSVVIEQKSIQEAKAMGAMALFGEKYGEVVRVVQVGDYSLELCGGCHVNNTVEIGSFKILSESGIGAGVRRIEAVTGRHSFNYLTSQVELLEQIADQLKSSVIDVPKRVDGLQHQLKELSRENESLRAKLGNIEAITLVNDIKEVNGTKYIAAKVEASDMDTLRGMVDDLKAKGVADVIVLGSVAYDKVQLVTSVSKDKIGQGYHAGNLIKEVAAVCGGGGGGRPEMAQAGGKDPQKLEEALLIVEKYLRKEI